MKDREMDLLAERNDALREIESLKEQVERWASRAHQAEAALVAMDEVQTRIHAERKDARTGAPTMSELHGVIVQSMRNLMPVNIQAAGQLVRLMAVDAMDPGHAYEVAGRGSPHVRHVHLDRGEAARVNNILSVLRGYEIYQRGYRERLVLLNPVDLAMVIQEFARARTDDQLHRQLESIGRIEFTQR